CQWVQSVTDNAALLAANTQSHNMLYAKIGAVGTDVRLLCQDLCKAVDCITKPGTRVSDVEDSVKMLQEKVDTLTVVTKELAVRVEDA
ncbi:hypothetical protein NDU88_006298, partial [Pleurodeles waltl]